MPSRRDNQVSTRRRNNSQQAEDVTEVGSNQRNNGQGMPSRRDNRVSTRGCNNSQQAKDVTEVGSNHRNNGQGMPLRRDNRVSTRGRNNSQQDEEDKLDLPLEHELDEPGPQDIYSKVIGNDKNGTVEMYGLVREAQMQGSNDNNSYGTNVRLQVYLNSILNSEIVAKGWIRSLDQDEVLGSEEIRPNWYAVDV
ncbi:hypothetical protein Tco_0856513 [Tanacetum coccineum]|uniref:Uncharacterized protein n=1 Tax=Tanacetum coccineum TaxID=301880 RepID=A0ABQ5B3L1_9ASTR